MPKYTPENILDVADDEVFVFGANRAGKHGAGAAQQALRWGAVMGQIGLVGRTYGLCTKDENIITLPLSEIQKEVNKFAATAKTFPRKTFLVTKVGCGLAGMTVGEIAPLFSEIYAGIEDGSIKNILLPREFCEFIDNYEIFQ